MMLALGSPAERQNRMLAPCQPSRHGVARISGSAGALSFARMRIVSTFVARAC